jgi:hypothetical protein
MHLKAKNIWRKYLKNKKSSCTIKLLKNCLIYVWFSGFLTGKRLSRVDSIAVLAVSIMKAMKQRFFSELPT